MKMASRHITVASVVRIDFVRASDPAHVRVNRPKPLPNATSTGSRTARGVLSGSARHQVAEKG
jgi:hypothetical protein